MVALSQQKSNMLVNLIKPSGVSPETIEIMAAAPWEHCFATSEYQHLVFADCGVPLAKDRLTYSPIEVAQILESLQLKSTDTVLEIGSSGMLLTSIFADRCCSVISVEADEAVHRADANLRQQLDLRNVQCILGDATMGWEQDTYSVVVVNGALPFVSKDLAMAVALAGRLFVVLGRGRNKQACLIDHLHKGAWHKTHLFETEQAILSQAKGADSFEF